MTGGTEWERYAAEGVLLDGFHALKHALRFGARVPVAVARDKTAALALAAELAPDLTGALEELLDEVPGGGCGPSCLARTRRESPRSPCAIRHAAASPGTVPAGRRLSSSWTIPATSATSEP